MLVQLEVECSRCHSRPSACFTITGLAEYAYVDCACLAAYIWSRVTRGGLLGTGSGIRERCTCRVLCLAASWSDARLMHLELTRSDCVASRLCLSGYLLGRLPPRCSQQACWSVLVFPPTRPVISLLSAAADVLCQPSS